MENTKDRIRNLIVEVGELEKTDWVKGTSLIDDLKFDSIKIINLMVALENEFNIEFDDMEMFIDKFENVIAFIDYVSAFVEK